MIKNLFLILLASSLLSCSNANLFEEFGDKESDEARLFLANEYINDGEYALAVAEFGKMSAVFLAQREVIVLHSSAHAGLCGLDFLRLLSSLEGISTERILPLFMKGFTGATALNVSSCIEAQDILASVAEGAPNRTEDENLLMTFISFAKIGSILSTYADSDADDTVDAGFDSCSAGDLPEADVREFGSSLIHIFASLSALEDAASIGDGELTDITNLFTSMDSALDVCDDTPADSGNCTNTNPDDYTALEVRTFRTLIREVDIVGVGLGTCTGNLATCICP